MPKQDNLKSCKFNKIALHTATGTYDLRPHLLELNVYENIFRSALTADINLLDSVNLPSKLSIIGQEVLDVDVMLQGFSADTDETLSINPPPLMVNSMPTRVFNKPKSLIFNLSMVSEQGMSGMHSKISKSYFDESISDIATDIWLTYLDHRTDDEKRKNIRTLNVEDTDRTERIIIPTMNPLLAMKWLTKRAEQSETTTAASGVNYLFYETVDSSNFVSLHHLVTSQKPYWTFKIMKPVTEDAYGTQQLADGIVNVVNWRFLKSFNRKDQIENGIYSSKLITHDIVTKTIEQHDYDGWSQWPELEHLGDYPPLNNSLMDTKSSFVSRTSHAPSGGIDFPDDSRTMGGQTDGNIEFFPKHDNMYSQNYNDGYDNYVEYWKQKRKNHLGIWSGLSILIEITGISTLRVGQLVNLEVPSPETSEEDGKADLLYDTFISGVYMITAIQHQFRKDINSATPNVEYWMNVELSKDGFESKTSTRKSRKE